MHLVNGTGNSPSPGRPTPGVVKQDKSSRASIDTTKPRSDPQRVRMSSGEKPIGAAKGKQTSTMASCQTPHLGLVNSGVGEGGFCQRMGLPGFHDIRRVGRCSSDENDTRIECTP